MKQVILRAALAAVLSGGLLVSTGCAATGSHKSAGEVVDDAVVTTKVKAALAGDETTHAFEISVDTYRGVVQLSGFVSSQAEINRATEVARGVEGVKSVKNNLQLKPKP